VNADTVAAATKKGFWESFRTRLVTALVLACVALTALELGGLFFGLISFILTAVLSFEWIRMTCKRQCLLTLSISILHVTVTFFTLCLYGIEFAFFVGAGGTLFIAIMANKENHKVMWVCTGIFIFILTMISINWIRNYSPNGLHTIYWVFSVVWATDVGAYIFGNLFKGPLLAAKVSPSKTWSGALSGIICGSTIGTLILYLFFDFKLIDHHLGWLLTIIAGLLLSVLSQTGDLLESKVKRHFNVKDTGRWLRGHGGALDRLDGIILVIPILAFVIFIIGNEIK